MIDGFSFVHKDVLIPIFVGGLVVFGCYFYKEWKTRNRGKFTVNTIVAFLTITALVLLVLEPTVQVEISDRQGLLLTEGFDERQKDSLISLHEGLKVLNYNPKKSIRIELDSLTGLYVIGNGIESFDFPLFRDIPVEFIPTQKQSGITRLKYGKRIALGEKIEVKGYYNLPFKGSFLILQDSRGNGLDSIQFVENSDMVFSLEANSKVGGDYVYQLTLKDSIGVLLNTNPLPIEIMEKEPLRLLILNDFPTFESKYLKNFLAEEGHEVIVRSQLTKGKFKFEYFNTISIPVYQFANEILEQFDLVIVDADTYFSFSKTIKNRFEKSIRESGLGLFIQPSEFLFNLGKSSSYFKFRRDGIDAIEAPIFATTLEKYPYDFDELFSVHPISFGKTQSISAYKQMGLGRVSTTLLLNSYQLLLKGSDKGYKGIWTQIIDKIAKKKNALFEWEAASQIPRVDEPFDFVLRTNLKEFAILNDDSNRVAMLQQPILSTHYLGTIHPKKKGWNQLRIGNDSTSQFSFFVFDSLNWKSLSSSQTLDANKKEFKKGISENRTVVIDRPISLIIFYLLFLMGIGWLWLEPKLLSDK